MSVAESQSRFVSPRTQSGAHHEPSCEGDDWDVSDKGFLDTTADRHRVMSFLLWPMKPWPNTVRFKWMQVPCGPVYSIMARHFGVCFKPHRRQRETRRDSDVFCCTDIHNCCGKYGMVKTCKAHVARRATRSINQAISLYCISYIVFWQYLIAIS